MLPTQRRYELNSYSSKIIWSQLFWRESGALGASVRMREVLWGSHCLH